MNTNNLIFCLAAGALSLAFLSHLLRRWRRPALRAAPPRMQVIAGKQRAYMKDKARSTSDTHVDCYNYAEDWALLMEKAMAAGVPLEDIARPASFQADKYGMSGASYVFAVEILAAYWAHGESLRRWHNLSVRAGDQGEKANERGTVLNPASFEMYN